MQRAEGLIAYSREVCLRNRPSAQNTLEAEKNPDLQAGT